MSRCAPIFGIGNCTFHSRILLHRYGILNSAALQVWANPNPTKRAL